MRKPRTKTIHDTLFLRSAKMLLLSMDGKMRAGKIFRRSYLSYSTIKEYSEIFISEGLMKITKSDIKKPKTYYCLTEKGMRLKSAFVELDDIISRSDKNGKM